MLFNKKDLQKVTFEEYLLHNNIGAKKSSSKTIGQWCQENGLDQTTISKLKHGGEVSEKVINFVSIILQSEGYELVFKKSDKVQDMIEENAKLQNEAESNKALYENEKEKSAHLQEKISKYLEIIQQQNKKIELYEKEAHQFKGLLIGIYKMLYNQMPEGWDWKNFKFSTRDMINNKETKQELPVQQEFNFDNYTIEDEEVIKG